MKTFTEYLTEAADEKEHKTAVLSFGRLNPPTTGHAKLIDHMRTQKGHKHMVVSHSQDDKKNPLSAEEKVEYLKKMYPKNDVNFHMASKEHPSIFHHAALMHKQGYEHLHVIVGSDRVKEFRESLKKYNGVFKNGNGYNFKSIKVSSAGDRDPDAEGTTGMSASKMREHALNNDIEKFKSGLHPALHEHAPEIMTKIKERLKEK